MSDEIDSANNKSINNQQPFKVGQIVTIDGRRNHKSGEFVIKSIRTPAFETDCDLVQDDKIEIK